MLRFYARRIRRIAPALLACLLLTAVASVLFIPESWLSEASDKTGLMAFFGFSNWVLAAIGNDYFAPKAEFNPYTHTWSLGVEEQFYLLFRCCSWRGHAAYAGVGSVWVCSPWSARHRCTLCWGCARRRRRGRSMPPAPVSGNWAWACCCSSCACANHWTRQPGRR